MSLLDDNRALVDMVYGTDGMVLKAGPKRMAKFEEDFGKDLTKDTITYLRLCAARPCGNDPVKLDAMLDLYAQRYGLSWRPLDQHLKTLAQLSRGFHSKAKSAAS